VKVTRERLLGSISKKLGCPRCKSSVLLEALVEILINTLSSGEDVLISGFGKFEIAHKKRSSMRRYENPNSNGSRFLAFKCSPVLRAKLNDQHEIKKPHGPGEVPQRMAGYEPTQA
jgi:integration host factor subunit alpha